LVTERVNNIFIVCLFCLLTSIVKNLTIYSDDEWGVDESDCEEVYTHTEENSYDEIINKCDFGQRHLIGALISSTTTLLQSSEPGELNTLLDTSISEDTTNDNPKQHKIKTYPTMLKLISESLLGGANFNEIYLDPDDDDAFNSSSTSDSDTRKQEKDARNVPTLPEIARKVAKLQKIQLDKKQYIAYETIAFTFLLGLVKDGRDLHTNLGAYLQKKWEDQQRQIYMT
jgi:hypothetical protein